MKLSIHYLSKKKEMKLSNACLTIRGFFAFANLEVILDSDTPWILWENKIEVLFWMIWNSFNLVPVIFMYLEGKKTLKIVFVSELGSSIEMALTFRMLKVCKPFRYCLLSDFQGFNCNLNSNLYETFIHIV